MTARPCMQLDSRQRSVPAGKNAPVPAFFAWRSLAGAVYDVKRDDLSVYRRGKRPDSERSHAYRHPGRAAQAS